MTWMRPREKYGTRYLGMSPRGGIAEPPSPYYSETGAGCQCARWPCAPTTTASNLLSRNFYRARYQGDGQRYLDDQHHPRRQQQHQHEFAERGLVEAPVKFQAKPGAGEQCGQSDQGQFDGV